MILKSPANIFLSFKSVPLSDDSGSKHETTLEEILCEHVYTFLRNQRVLIHTSLKCLFFKHSQFLIVSENVNFFFTK